MTVPTTAHSPAATSKATARVGSVLQRVNRFWGGEAEVAETFFKSARTKDEHLHWLTSQMVRELGWPDGRITKLQQAFAQLEDGVGRHEVLVMFQVAEEENSHYVVLADIAEKIQGRSLKPAEFQHHRQGSEWQALDKVRTRQADWDRAVSGLHEGGGLGIYYAAMNLEPMPDDPYRADIAAAMRMIYDDELSHCAYGLAEVVQVAMDATDEIWHQVEDKAEAVGYHRLRMRNEQFGSPLPEARIQEIREGKIVPYLPPFPTLAEVVALTH